MSELSRSNVKRSDELTRHRDRINIVARAAKIEFSQNGWKLDHNDGFSGLSIQEMQRLGMKMIDCENVWQVYDLLSGPSSTGTNYYDLIIAPQHARAYDKMRKSLGIFEPERVDRGLDLASGTGEMALAMATKCDHVTAIDLMPSMLKLAELKLRKSESVRSFDTKVMDVLQLDFPPETFDIVIDNGMSAYLTPEELEMVFRQIHRVMKKNGRYYKYEAESHEPPEYQTSMRAQLAGELAAALIMFSFFKSNRDSKYSINFKDLGFSARALDIVDNIAPVKYKEVLIRAVKL